MREFGWNKSIKPAAKKTLSWNTDLDHEHGGGGAVVLTSVLFEDGTTWEDNGSHPACLAAWYNSHKKHFTKPIEPPPRQWVPGQGQPFAR